MKHQWKGFLCGILTALLLVGAVGTAAATVGSKTATLDYNNISVALDGKPVALADANGNAVEPFAIAGTTYLPVRAVASALGLNVNWNSATSTVELATQGATQVETPVVTPAPESKPTDGTQFIRGLSPDTTVYVSYRSNTVHSVHDCSGMKSYREMTIADATSRGYEFCPTCW